MSPFDTHFRLLYFERPPPLKGSDLLRREEAHVCSLKQQLYCQYNVLFSFCLFCCFIVFPPLPQIAREIHAEYASLVHDLRHGQNEFGGGGGGGEHDVIRMLESLGKKRSIFFPSSSFQTALIVLILSDRSLLLPSFLSINPGFKFQFCFKRFIYHPAD